MPAIAYNLLQRSILRRGEHAVLAKALGRDLKGKGSLGPYALAVGLAFKWPLASIAIYVLVAIIWLVPDTRIERVLSSENAAEQKGRRKVIVRSAQARVSGTRKLWRCEVLHLVH